MAGAVDIDLRHLFDPVVRPLAYDAPTLQEIRYWRDQAVNDWDQLDDDMEQDELLYLQEFDITTPLGHERFAVKTGSAPSDVDGAIDSITPADIQVRVIPARGTRPHEELADLLSRWGLALIRDWRRLKDIIRISAGDSAIRHVAVGRVLWDSSKEDRNPIVLQRRNPRFVRWRESEEDGTLLVVVERYETTVLEARRTFGSGAWGEEVEDNVAVILSGKLPDLKVWVDDVWTEKHRAIFIEDRPVFSEESETPGVMEHGYREIPYIIAPFRELPFEEPHRKYRGMLSNSRELYPLESNVLGMQVSMLATNAWRTWVGWTRDGREIKVLPGTFLTIMEQAGEYIRMLEGQPVPPELLQTSAVIDSLIQRNGVAQGPRSQEGTRSAQQVWAIQSIRQLKIESAKDAMIRYMNRALYLAACHLQDCGGGKSVTLPSNSRKDNGKYYGMVSVKAEDVKGYEEAFDVSFGRRLDPALIEQAKSLANLATNKWMPMRTSWEMSGLTDSPEIWHDLLILESVESLPFMLEIAGLMECALHFGKDSPEYAMLAQKIMENRQQQAIGAPGAPTQGMSASSSPKGPAMAAGAMPQISAGTDTTGAHPAQPPTNIPTPSAGGLGV